jgi:hypothetical protein
MEILWKRILFWVNEAISYNIIIIIQFVCQVEQLITSLHSKPLGYKHNHP